MRQTKNYLHDDLNEKLKVRSRGLGLSISELVLEKDIPKDPVAEARTYFECLKPLESLATVACETYVRSLRHSSRILKTVKAQ